MVKQHEVQSEESNINHKVERLKDLLGKFNREGHRSVEDHTLLNKLISELKHEQAEIVHELAKENAAIKSMLGGPTLAFAAADDDDDETSTE